MRYKTYICPPEFEVVDGNRLKCCTCELEFAVLETFDWTGDIECPNPDCISNNTTGFQQSSHYRGRIETIDFLKDKLTPEQFEGYLLGNIMKYASRHGKKDSKEKDAYKIADYAMYLAEGMWIHEWGGK